MANQIRLQQMLNNEVPIEGSFYKDLIALMEANPKYQAMKHKQFKNSRDLVKAYFPNQYVMCDDLIYGHNDAEYAFATMFLNGIIVEYDLDIAIYWLKRAYHDNSIEAFRLLRKIMEENGLEEDLKEFAMDAASLYGDPELIAFCEEKGYDYCKPSLKQRDLVKEYLGYYKRYKREANDREKQLIDEILTSADEDSTVRLVKELEPQADERLIRLFHNAEPDSTSSYYIDEICDEGDPEKKQALINKYKINPDASRIFWDYEEYLKLTDYDKMFKLKFVSDFSFLDCMEHDSPNFAASIRHRTYKEQTEAQRVVHAMMDHDHRLTYQATTSIVQSLIDEECEQLKKCGHKEDNTSRDTTKAKRPLIFYNGPYLKRQAIFMLLAEGKNVTDVSSYMYDYVLNNILFETVINADVPAQLGIQMTFDALMEEAENKIS